MPFRRRPPAAPPPLRAVTASAALTTSVGVNDRLAGAHTSRTLHWQERSVAYYEQLGVIWYAAQFYARALSKLRIFPAIKTGDGEIEQLDDPAIMELLDEIQDPGGGRAAMFGSYGRLMFLIGEAQLLCTLQDDEPVWEIVSRFELEKRNDGTYVRKGSPDAKPEVLKPIPDGADSLSAGECVVYRLWRRHPIWSKQADAPMRGVLDDCEELVMLTNAVRRRARSRLSGPGILLIPEQLSPTPVEPGPDEDPEEDPLMQDIIEATVEPIRDEESVSGQVPIIVRGDGDWLEKIRLLRFTETNETYQEAKLRAEAMTRLGIGLDMPPEELLGQGESNHWSSSIIDDDKWTVNLQPMAQQLVDDFASAYLRPAAKEAGYARWEELVIGYDNAEIVNRPNRGKDADEAHDRLTISDAAHREAKGFTDEDAPDEEERRERIGIKIRSPLLALGEEEPEPGEPPPAGPPEEPPAVTAAGTLDPRWVMGAATMTVERARELAGSRIRTRTKACGPCQKQIDGISNALVASVLGREESSAAGSDADLVSGAADSLVGRLARSGLSTETALQIGVLVEEHAAQTLYDPDPPPLELPSVLDLVAA